MEEKTANINGEVSCAKVYSDVAFEILTFWFYFEITVIGLFADNVFLAVRDYDYCYSKLFSYKLKVQCIFRRQSKSIRKLCMKTKTCC